MGAKVIVPELTSWSCASWLHLGLRIAPWLEQWAANLRVVGLNPIHTCVCRMFPCAIVSRPYASNVTSAELPKFPLTKILVCPPKFPSVIGNFEYYYNLGCHYIWMRSLNHFPHQTHTCIISASTECFHTFQIILFQICNYLHAVMIVNETHSITIQLKVTRGLSRSGAKHLDKEIAIYRYCPCSQLRMNRLSNSTCENWCYQLQSIHMKYISIYRTCSINCQTEAFSFIGHREIDDWCQTDGDTLSYS